MRPKPLALFTAAVAVLFVLTLWWNHREGPALPTDEKVGQPILATGDLRETTQIEIRKGEETITLALHENWWQITEYHDLPVNNEHLRAVASSLTEGKITRFVTAREERRERLGFPGRHWEFRSAEGELLAALETGRQTGDGRTFFRYSDEEAIYLGDFTYELPSQPKDWIDHRMTDFSVRDLSSVTITLEEGKEVTLQRSSPDDRWSSEDFPEGTRLRQTAINDLLRSWGRIRLMDTHDFGKKDGFDTAHPERKATLKFFNRSPLEIRLAHFSSEESEDEETEEVKLTTLQVIPEREPHRLHQFNRQRLLEVRHRLYEDFPLRGSDLARIPREEASSRGSSGATVSVTSEPLSLPSEDEALPESPSHDSEEEQTLE